MESNISKPKGGDLNSLFIVFSIFTIIMILTYVLIVFGGFKLPLSTINFFCTAVVSLWIFWRLRQKKSEGEEVTSQIRDFTLAYLLFGIFMLSLSLPTFILPFNQELYSPWSVWTHKIGHLFLFLSLVFFVRVPLAWINPKLKNLGSTVVFIFGAVTGYLNIITPSGATLLDSGINIRQIDPTVGTLIILNVVLSWMPTALYFLYRAIRAQDHFTKIRSLLFGLGFLITILGGPTHNIIQSPLVFLIADIMTLIGIALIASGVFYQIATEKLTPSIALKYTS